ncbi:sensor domain-containing protein [Umezawaea sp. Da 62-37]|uniref:sensor histidine kinase n=1 Tax=Umezawaea sp. Da 62-37 TaxID=3075927 RepID=UPI0028F70B13|nr:sensor domain-containing protein [Umezawaea sp. Da 62-37]WNV82590.1 sensor domain-containing protein [Umezawaea sp. Da 62-37]
MTTRPLPKIARTSVFLLVNFFISTLWFVVLVSMFATSIGLAVVWLGIPLLAVTLLIARGASALERMWVHTMLGTYVASPYRPLPEGGVLARTKAVITDPAAWRDLGYWMLMFPLSIVEFVLVVTFWPVALSLIAYPLVYDRLMAYVVVELPGGGEWAVDSFARAIPVTVVGLLLGLLTVPLVRGLGRLHGSLARNVLGPSRTALLSAEAKRLHASRARGVDSAEAERRRIERDLHDGAQQRLVAVAMTLGRAKTKMDSDPDAARELIAEAHVDAKLAISELRDLARGIYPSVLGDRGLDPALSSLISKCPIPVDLSVDVEPRPPTAVESAAYFTVAETLTNIAKHAEATRVGVKVFRTDRSVVVEVTDDGKGGAEVRKGGGLAGLADRAATIDGVVVVVSPVGGPTVIRTELPCAW